MIGSNIFQSILTLACRVTAKSEEQRGIFVCRLSYGLRMKTSAGKSGAGGAAQTERHIPFTIKVAA
jgi:hypothetical protein